MKIVLFYHSLISDWNHGNAHFLRGTYASLQRMGHEVIVYEPEGGWSLTSLVEDYGQKALSEFHLKFPELTPHFYDPRHYELREMLHGADLVIVHEWNDPELVKAIGEFRLVHDFLLFFHDTHHRAVSAPTDMQRYDLSHYDVVLAFGESLTEVYRQMGWHDRVWTWHEAADVSTYYPVEGKEYQGDVVWIGNWGDEERTQELHEFIIEPIKALKLKAKFFGVRYPQHALAALADAGIEYGGYLPSTKVAETFADYRATIHVPRRFYLDHLPGIPTIRPFEAMACKIPLLSAPWVDSENLFTAGKDYLLAQNGRDMMILLAKIITEPTFSKAMADHAYDTIISKHTCDHRAHELLEIYSQCVSEKNKKGGLL